MTTRAARRAGARTAAPGGVGPRARDVRRQPRPAHRGIRIAAFLAIAVLVIGGGLYFAGNIFLRDTAPGMDMTGQTTVTAPASGSIDLRVSMDGFDPKVIKAKPGQELTFDWWNSDGAMHLENGVHTLVSDALGIRFELPAQSHKTITMKAPDKPGDYDYWCDSCCGGKENPGMHARIEVEA